MTDSLTPTRLADDTPLGGTFPAMGLLLNQTASSTEDIARIIPTLERIAETHAAGLDDDEKLSAKLFALTCGMVQLVAALYETDDTPDEGTPAPTVTPAQCADVLGPIVANVAPDFIIYPDGFAPRT